MKIKVKQFQNGEWYVAIIAANGEPTFNSEGHKNKQDAIDLAQNTKKNLGKATIYIEDSEIKDSTQELTHGY